MKICKHEMHGGVCKKTETYCNLGACPYEEPIEVTEVVRCKDCKWHNFGKYFNDIKFCQRLPIYAQKGGLNTADDDFCSYGEKKEE